MIGYVYPPGRTGVLKDMFCPMTDELKRGKQNASGQYIYYVKVNGKTVFKGKLKEAAVFVGMSRQYILDACRYKTKILGKYTVKRKVKGGHFE